MSDTRSPAAMFTPTLPNRIPAVACVAAGLVLLLLGGPAASAAPARPPAPRAAARRVAAALAAGQLARAAALVDQALEAASPSPLQQGLLLFLKVLALQRAGRFTEAIGTAADTDFDLLPAGLRHHLEALLGMLLADHPRKPADRRRAEQLLVRVGLQGRYGPSARFALLRLLLRSGHLERACSLAAETARRLERRPAESRALNLLARCHRQRAARLSRAGDRAAARDELRRAATNYRLAAALWPATPAGKQAGAALEQLAARKIRAAPAEGGRLLQRLALLAHHPRGRRDLWRLLRLRRLAPGPASGPWRCSADLLAAELAVRFRWFRTARRLLRRVRRRAEDVSQRARAALDLASLTARYSFPAALQAYSQVARLWPGSEAAAWALLLGGKMLLRRGRQQEASGWLRRAVSLRPDGLVALQARFSLAWQAGRHGEVDRALALLEAVLAGGPQTGQESAPPEVDLAPAAERDKPSGDGDDRQAREPADPAAEAGPGQDGGAGGEQSWQQHTPPRDGFDIHQRARYWRARFRLLAGDRAGAVSDLVQVIEERPLGYYAVLAAARLRECGARPPWQQVLLNPVSSLVGPTSMHVELQAARSYLELGLSLEARATLLALDRRRLSYADRLELARLWLQAGEPSAAVWSAPLPFSAGVPGFPSPRALAAARLAYPRAFAGVIEGPDRDDRVEPELAYALVRAESSFRPRARSPAGALGLTQLVRRTARRTAHRLRLRSFRFWQLLRPERAVRLGTAHLGDLLDRYCGSLPLALAAYNAGSGAVDRWLAGLGDDQADTFVEEIPYLETGRYVRKVISFTAVYRALYRQDASWAPRLRIAPELLPEPHPPPPRKSL